MTSQEQGLREAICADPQDVSVRLIYADWLEDHGQAERAEFIRVQCELAGMPPKPERCIGEIIRSQQELEWHNQNCPKCNWPGNTLARRELALLNRYGVLWFRGEFWALFPEDSTEEKSATFRRGFIETIVCTCTNWLRHGPAIVRAQPVLEVKLTDIGELTDLLNLRQHNSIAWARGPHPDLKLEALERYPGE